MATADLDAREALCWLPEQWSSWLASQGERPYRALQVFRWIHQRGVMDPAQMTDLGRSLRDRLSQLGLQSPAALAKEPHWSDDDTRKLLVRYQDGGTVETVLIPALQEDSEEDAEAEAEPESGERRPERRVTQCISSQVGCAMGCVFCASGVAGLTRNLSAGEVLAQVLLGRAQLVGDEALRNVVLMGMGEPLHNYGNTARVLRLLTHREGIGLSTRRVTVSTSGLVPEIDKLGAEFNGHIGLAVSLHAPEDGLRSRLMPINRRYPLAELMASLRRYPLPPRRRITIEYTLIDGVNDGDSEARALAKLLRGLPVKVNLIPMNPIDSSELRMPTRERVERFQELLRAEHYSVFVRRQRGDDVSAACGQLAMRDATRKVRRLPVTPPQANDHG